jgi:hypothetical protein
MLASAVAGLTVSAGLALHAQDTPEALLACVTNGTKVRHTYIQHRDPAQLKEAVRIFETQAQDTEYPEGTILRVIPQEAMVKRSRTAFAKTNGWEYFALAVTPQGTTVRERGETASNRLGTCQSCHQGAVKFDYVCAGGHGCANVPLTDEQIAALQNNDPRCVK